MLSKHLMLINQRSPYMQQLCINNFTTVSSCGYITCALVQYLSQMPFQQTTFHKFQQQLSLINQNNLTPYLEKCMQSIKRHRISQINKYDKQIKSVKQKQKYLKDWVANYQIKRFIQQEVIDKAVNKQVYFFRQSAYDQPQALKQIKYQQSHRVKQQLKFKGQQIFFSRFYPQSKDCYKHTFLDQIKQCNKNNPIIIATDVMGHFNLMILFRGFVYVIDSLTEKKEKSFYDEQIGEYITEMYKRSYIKE